MGIQSRIFICFLLFICLMLLLLWLLQIEFLGLFYRLEKEKNLRLTSDTIARNLEHSQCDTLVERMAEENNLCILVTDDQFEPIYTGEGIKHCVIHYQNPRELGMLVPPKTEDGKIHFVLMSRFLPPSLEKNVFEGALPTPDANDTRCLLAVEKAVSDEGKVFYIFLNTLVAPVHSTVQTIRSQLLFISIALVLLGFLLSTILSRQISSPIVKITKEARNLGKGEYSPIGLKGHYREVVELNTQLTQTAKDLHRVEEMRRELIGNISHDLRTPLTLIEGYLEAMHDIPGENTPENLQIILDETRRLTSLVNTIVDYSKGRIGENQPMEIYSLTKSVQEIVERYAKLMNKEGYHIEFIYEKEAFVKAHPLKISQIIYNLLNNALTYSGPEKRVQIRQTISDEKVKLEIMDEGEGIPPEELPHIWTRYYRGKKPHVRPAAGVGLGLSIAKEILDSYQMEYGVQSQQGKGSNFWFVLPVLDASGKE